MKDYPFLLIADARANCLNEIRRIVVKPIVDSNLAETLLQISFLSMDCEVTVKKIEEKWKAKQNPNSNSHNRIWGMDFPVNIPHLNDLSVEYPQE